MAPSIYAADGIAGSLPDPDNPDKPDKPDNPSDDGGLSTGGIVIIVIIAIILIFILIIGCVWYIRKQNQEEESVVDGDSELDRTREILRQKYGS